MQSFEKKIWMYWENKKGSTKPAYLDLALETIKKNSGDYEVVLLDENSVEEYITLSPFVKRISSIVQRSDIIRFNLLYKYGGIWLDSDMILLRDISEAVDPHIEKFDYVGCGIEYAKPSIWFMAARAGCKLIGLQLEGIEKYLAKKKRWNIIPFLKVNVKWLELGYDILWKFAGQYEYYHHEYKMFAPTVWNDWEIFNSTDIEVEDYLINNPFAVTLYNEKMFPTYKDMTRDELLQGNTLISKLFRKALDLN